MIDLSKLKALELPTKEIEIEILGEKQNTVITALPMSLAVKISTLTEINRDNPELPSQVIREVLLAGAKEISPEEVELLLVFEFPAAAKIAAAIRDLTKEFTEECHRKKEEFEKNSGAVELTSESLS